MDSTEIEPAQSAGALLSTGVAGLDEILEGGLLPERMYLVLGGPGSGKTTLGLQFLLDGAGRGEPCLFVALGETRVEIEGVAASHGWSLAGLDLHEPPAEVQDRKIQTILRPDEVELEEVLRPLFERIDRVRPRRAVIDSLTELRLLSNDMLRFREQLFEIKRRVIRWGGTLLVLDDTPPDRIDRSPQTFAHGVIELDRSVPDYGMMRRRVLVHKVRGGRFREGWHDLQIERGGLVVFPRTLPAEPDEAGERGVITSGDEALDRLVGPVPQGCSVLLIGASGTGKSTLAAQYVHAVAGRGEGAAVFLFDERRETFLARAAATGSDLGPHVDDGRVSVRLLSPAEISPGQLSAMVHEAVERGGVRLVVIDSLDGYLLSTPGERFSILYLRELLTWLGHRGVTAITTLVHHDAYEAGGRTHSDLSYLADVVILLRFFEAGGSVRKAVSVVKNRVGAHGAAICEIRVDEGGVHAGEPLVEFQGVLTGTPVYLGTEARLHAANGREHERS